MNVTDEYCMDSLCLAGSDSIFWQESYIQGLPKFLPFVEHYAFLSVRRNKVKINQARKPTGREFVANNS